MKRRLLTLMLAFGLALATNAATSPDKAAAACPAAYLTVADGNAGTGHATSFAAVFAGGNCGQPIVYKDNLNNNPAVTCIGFGGIDQNDWSDCINSVRLSGNWPIHARFRGWVNEGQGGSVTTAYLAGGCLNAYYTLPSSFRDVITSLEVDQGSGTCS